MTTFTLFVGGIAPSASRADIEAEFKKFGRCSCSFPSRSNFGFIEYNDRKEAKDAMLHIHGMKFAGERLGVDWQKKKAAVMNVWGSERRRAPTSNGDRRTGDSRDRLKYRDRDKERERKSGRGRDATGSYRSDSRVRDRHVGRDWNRGRERLRERNHGRDGRDGRRGRGSRENDRDRDRYRNHQDHRDHRDSYRERGDARDKRPWPRSGREELPSDRRRTSEGAASNSEKDWSRSRSRSRSREGVRSPGSHRQDSQERQSNGAGGGSKMTKERNDDRRAGADKDGQGDGTGWVWNRASQRQKEKEMLAEMMEEERKRVREKRSKRGRESARDKEKQNERRDRSGNIYRASPRDRSSVSTPSRSGSRGRQDGVGRGPSGTRRGDDRRDASLSEEDRSTRRRLSEEHYRSSASRWQGSDADDGHRRRDASREDGREIAPHRQPRSNLTNSNNGRREGQVGSKRKAVEDSRAEVRKQAKNGRGGKRLQRNKGEASERDVPGEREAAGRSSGGSEKEQSDDLEKGDVEEDSEDGKGRTANDHKVTLSPLEEMADREKTVSSSEDDREEVLDGGKGGTPVDDKDGALEEGGTEEHSEDDEGEASEDGEEVECGSENIIQDGREEVSGDEKERETGPGGREEVSSSSQKALAALEEAVGSSGSSVNEGDFHSVDSERSDGSGVDLDCEDGEEEEDESVAEGRSPELGLGEIEAMTLSELRDQLKLRNLNFSGKRPALTQRLATAVGIL